jgi:hypothetical protein
MASERVRRARDDDGAVLVIVAATLAAIFIVAALVINLGGARHAREHDQDSADAIATAGAAKLSANGASNQNACNSAWNYAVSNLGVPASPAPSCVNMAGTCVATTARTVSVTTGNYVFSFVNPVPDSHSLFTGQPATSGDSTPCNRFGVQITHTWRFPFSRGDQTLSVKAVARFAHSPGTVDAPLILLDPHGCEAMTITGNSHISTVTSGGLPGYIAVDSDGASCPTGSKVIVDATGNAQVTAGAISMWALTTGNTAKAYDPADVGVGRAFYPGPIASSAPVGRSSVDWRYNCSSSNGCPTADPPAVGNLITAQGGTGTPTGFTVWTSVYSCSPGTLNVPAGNWYIDCPSGLSTSGTLTFRGGNIVTDGEIALSGNGSLRVNCDVVDAATACPSNPATTTTMFFRHGGMGKAGNTTMMLYETFAYFADGSVDLSGNSQLVWTAPNDPSSPFDDLLLWTESSNAIPMTGNSDTTIEGIFFAPNATLDLTGNTGTNALGSQMFVNKATLTGNSTLNLSPNETRMMKLGGASAALIR